MDPIFEGIVQKKQPEIIISNYYQKRTGHVINEAKWQVVKQWTKKNSENQKKNSKTVYFNVHYTNSYELKSLFKVVNERNEANETCSCPENAIKLQKERQIQVEIEKSIIFPQENRLEAAETIRFSLKLFNMREF